MQYVAPRGDTRNQILGQKLHRLTALRDPQLQRLAWEKHGFRSGLMGVAKTADLPIAGVPLTIDAVLQMPTLTVWTKLTESLSTHSR